MMSNGLPRAAHTTLVLFRRIWLICFLIQRHKVEIGHVFVCLFAEFKKIMSPNVVRNWFTMFVRRQFRVKHNIGRGRTQLSEYTKSSV